MRKEAWDEPLENILEALAEGILIIDKYRRITFVNSSAEMIIGLGRSELVGRVYTEIVSRIATPEGKPFAVEDLASSEVIRTGKPVYGREEMFERPDGSKVIISVNAMPIYRAKRIVVGVVVSLTDITERKLAEEAMRASEANYRAIFNAANDAIIVHDIKTGGILDANRKAEELYGYAAEEIRLLNIVDLSAGKPPFSQENARRWVEKAAKEGPQLFEWLAKDKYDHLFWVEVNLKKAVIGGEERVLAAVRDISERKKLEDERMQLAEQVQLLLESTDEGIYGIDLEGHATLFNRAASRMTGYSPEEAVGKNVHELLHYKHPDGTPYPIQDCPVVRAFRVGQGVRIDAEVFWRKDGTPFPVEYSSYPIIEGGVIRGAVVTFTDITRRKMTEAAVRESESRYRSLFEDSPVSLWEEDLSDIKAYLDELRSKGIENFREHFDSHPETVKHLVSMVKVADVNRATLDLYKATSKKELKENLRVVFSDESYETFKEETIALAEGATKFESEATNRTLTGKQRNVVLRLFIAPGHEKTWGKIFVSITDITERKRAEELSNALNNINSAISSTLDFDEIMQRVVIASAQALRADVAAIALHEDDHWVARYLYGAAVGQAGMQLSGEEIAYISRVLRGKKSLAIGNALEDTSFDPELARRYGIKSILAVPLWVKDEPVGVLRFVYHKTAITFTDAQLDFANKLSVSVSLAIENARLYAAERNIADTLQEALLTVPKQIEGIDFGYLYRSATETAKVGGDFYDLFELEHGRVGIVVGDVSGKGLEAATLTSLVKTTIKVYAYEDSSPASVMAKTNEVVTRVSASSIFITVFFGILDTATGALMYCSAGHPPAILKRHSGETGFLTTSSPVIGAFHGLNYIDDRIVLEKGDIVVLYTDGVTEARCSYGFFGDERLAKLADSLGPMHVKELPTEIFKEIMRCTGGRLSDDIALLAISY
ncbi:MAG: PAS domain S-box protein [Candidatus Aquicultor sp.]